MSNLVETWFGESFKQLDPLIQQLHLSQHSVLKGEIVLEYGAGLAGLIGKRLGFKLGLPPGAGVKDFQVEIQSANGLLIWSRVFDSQYKMVSVFKPVGTYPNGHWQEITGVMKMDLGVQIKEGGWHWVQKRVWYKSIPLPLWMFPASIAYKKIVEEEYEFKVSITLPLIGQLLSYSGRLRLKIL